MRRFLHLPLAVMQLFATVTSAYDIGCLIGDMPNDPIAVRGNIAGTFLAFEDPIETPIVIYSGHRYTYCQTGCTAYHSSTAQMPEWEGDAPFRVPDKYHDTWSRVVCHAQCAYELNEVDLKGSTKKTTGELLDEWNVPYFKTMNEDLIACDGDSGCIEALVEANDWDPRLIGQVLFLEVERHSEDDGWNKDGKLTWDSDKGEAVPCTANCAPYSDTTGYYPKNQPGIASKEHEYKWQPIQEHDGNGYFSRQEHVTPHIGFTVKPKLLKEWREAPAPEYDYVVEAQIAMERMRDMTSSEEQKDMIRFYDNKLGVRGLIQYYVRSKYAGRDNFSYEDYMYYLQGIDSAEYDALLQSWREKVNHDLIRPTTYIHDKFADKSNLSYGGDPKATEPVLIKGRDFQPFIRVMPHSEYPSGSGCLCLAYQEFTEEFVKQEFGDNTIPDMSVGLDGVVNIDGIPSRTSGDKQFYIGDLNDLKEQCGQSRLWGGMHFTASVDVTNEICGGLGGLALEKHNEMKGTGEWGSVWKEGDPRPTCPM